MLNAGTERYLLKLTITYYHSMRRSTVSKRRVDVPWITTQLVYLSSLIFDKRFFLRQCWHCFGLQETQAASADERPNLHLKVAGSNLEPVNPSLEKFTKRYVLKPNILIGSPPNEETRLDALGFALFGLWYPEFQFDYFPCSTLNHCKCRMDISWS